MTLWLAISQQSSPRSCIANLPTCAEPRADKDKVRPSYKQSIRKIRHVYLRRASTWHNSVIEDGTQRHSSVSYKHVPHNSMISIPTAWQSLVAILIPYPGDTDSVSLRKTPESVFLTNCQVNPQMSIWDAYSVFEGQAEKNAQESSVVAFYTHGLQALNIPNYSAWLLELMSPWFCSSEVGLDPHYLPTSCFLLRAPSSSQLKFVFLKKVQLYSSGKHTGKNPCAAIYCMVLFIWNI